MTQTARALLCLTLALGALEGCANYPGPQAEGRAPEASGLSGRAEPHMEPDDDGIEIEGFADKAACGGRYELSASAEAAGSAVNLSYDGAGNQCSGGPTSGAEALKAYILQNFGGQTTGEIGTYSCRNIVGGSGLSVHGTGRALDVMIPTQGGAADNVKGDAIANWLIENAQSIGVQLIIWDRTIWNPNHDPRARCYGGEHPHNDHVHVELTIQAGEKGTPFFNGGNVAPPGGGGAPQQSPDQSAPDQSAPDQSAPDQSAPGGDVGQGAGCPDEDWDGYCDDPQAGAGGNADPGQDAGGCVDEDWDGYCDDPQAGAGGNADPGQDAGGCVDADWDGYCDDPQAGAGGNADQGQDAGGCVDADWDGYCDDPQAGADANADNGGGDECSADADCGDGGYCDAGVCYWNI